METDRWKMKQPFNNIMVTNSSFASMTTGTGLEALLFPSFEVIHVRKLDHTVAEKFVREHLLPETLHPMHSGLSDAHKLILTRKPRSSTSAPVYNLTRPTILICSHNSRDTRCGVMGPLLQSEFVRQLQRLEYLPATEYPVDTSSQDIQTGPGQPEPESGKVNVGLISHVGGHKWAGNAIIYIPPTWAKDGNLRTLKEQKANPSPLAGCGIWYGRVEPKHVEGIIKETILGGTVIKELFRGGIGPNSEVLRLPL
jgi:(2Fe-2S) ferredoxin